MPEDRVTDDPIHCTVHCFHGYPPGFCVVCDEEQFDEYEEPNMTEADYWALTS